MKTLSGTVYRAPSGYWHCRDTTIADVLAFERDELGNEDQLPDVPETVLEQSAKHCAWVALDPDTAACYGNRVIEIELDNAVIIASVRFRRFVCKKVQYPRDSNDIFL